jgi:hypothetical protein
MCALNCFLRLTEVLLLAFLGMFIQKEKHCGNKQVPTLLAVITWAKVQYT